jgi:SAM-dependent methyltransferase
MGEFELTAQPDIAAHYSRGGLLQRLRTALAADGADPDHPTLEALAPYDQFHGRGIEATAEIADALSIANSDHILDIGSGVGGPARYFADRFGCRVTGIDLTAEFCAVARELTRLTGLDDRVQIHEGTALAMPFAAESFDGAYSINVAMNIADKDGLYREIRRVLKPDAWLVLSEAARGPGPAPDYPTPWADTAASSFLATPDETRRRLEAGGFAVITLRETTQQALAYGARSRALVQRGEKPPHRAVSLIHGERVQAMAANVARGLGSHALIPIEVLCRKRA